MRGESGDGRGAKLRIVLIYLFIFMSIFIKNWPMTKVNYYC